MLVSIDLLRASVLSYSLGRLGYHFPHTAVYQRKGLCYSSTPHLAGFEDIIPIKVFRLLFRICITVLFCFCTLLLTLSTYLLHLRFIPWPFVHKLVSSFLKIEAHWFLLLASFLGVSNGSNHKHRNGWLGPGGWWVVTGQFLRWNFHESRTNLM